MSNNAPIYKSRSVASGAIDVAVWGRNGKNGPFPGFTIRHTRKDENSGEYVEQTLNINPRELLAAMTEMQRAYDVASRWTAKAQQEAKAKAQSNNNNDDDGDVPW